MSRRSYFVTVRACGITETNGKMDLHNGMGFELELANADTVAWSGEVSILKEKARNKKSSKKKAREYEDKSSIRSASRSPYSVSPLPCQPCDTHRLSLHTIISLSFAS